MSAEAYLDFFGKASCLRQALPFREDKLKEIPIPTLAIVPDKDEWCSTTPEDYFHKLQSIGVMARLVESDHNLTTVKALPKHRS
jgi:hypothetical protein